MSVTAVLSQNCGLWVLDDSVSPAVVRQVLQTKGLTALGGSRAVIDITCLESQAKEKLPALIDNGAATFDLVYNPLDLGQQLLESLAGAGTKVLKQFYLGLSDGSGGPPTFSGTIGAGTLLLKGPVTASPKKYTRSGWLFSAYVKQFARDIAVDGVVNVKAAMEISGIITPTYYNTAGL